MSLFSIIIYQLLIFTFILKILLFFYLMLIACLLHIDFKSFYIVEYWEAF